MARLNEEQIMGIKEHMCSDEKKLASDQSENPVGMLNLHC